jgi:hypothetical protein
MNTNLDTRIDPQPELAKSKRAPQFGWVKKLQRTAGFQTVRGGYLVFFQNPFENHRDINLDSRQFEVDIWFFSKTRLRTTEIYDNHEYQL